MSVCYYC